MKTFLITTALLEGITGLVLIIAPQWVISLLLSTTTEVSGGFVAAHIAGATIGFLALQSWLHRNRKNNSRIMNFLLIYNLSVAAIFLVLKLIYGITGPFVWLVLIVHVVLGVWEIALMRRKI